MLKPVSTLLHAWLLIVFMGTFLSIAYIIHDEPAVTPPAILTPTPVPRPSGISQTIPETGWSLIQPGLERRLLDIYDAQNQQVESLNIWRLDQDYFRLDVAFSETPRSLESWQAVTNAAIVLNGGYYSIDNERYFPDGLMIVDGQVSGRSFAGFGGMLAIKESGTELRWLVERPYEPGEQFQAVLQSFPILVKPGGQLGFPAGRENHVSARRTVIAQDEAGRMLLMVAPSGYFTLHQLSLYLTESDLDLDIAVNLDGGGSAGILVANPREVIAPGRPLPFVILVYPR